jgi:hypothetical protein
LNSKLDFARGTGLATRPQWLVDWAAPPNGIGAYTHFAFFEIASLGAYFELPTRLDAEGCDEVRRQA